MAWPRGFARWRNSRITSRCRSIFPQHGYHTYSTGKIYHGGYGRKKTDKEFDELGPPASVGVRPKQKLVDTPAKHPLVDWGVFPHKDEDKGDWKVASWAVDQINKHPQEPFFLVGRVFPAARALLCDAKMVRPLPRRDNPSCRRCCFADREDTPRFSWYLHWKLPEPRLKFLREANQWKNLVRSYMACTSFVDSQVGRMLDALEAKGLAENTIVVLWSDHGWHLGEKEITGKNTLWDRSTRVPLIFAGPGITAGQKCSKPAELLDMYPTLIDLCGLPKRTDLEGHSLLPQLKDATPPANGRRSRRTTTTTTASARKIGATSATPTARKSFTTCAKTPTNGKTSRAIRTTRTSSKQHRQWLPKHSAPPAPGSKHRILIYKDGKANWEGEDIGKDEPIPEI